MCVPKFEIKCLFFKFIFLLKLTIKNLLKMTEAGAQLPFTTIKQDADGNDKNN